VLPLFDDRPAFDRHRLAARLAYLAQRNVFVGTSSWKYQGWLDQIYTPSRYANRGKFSNKRFEAECISEYAEVFPAVCGDFAFYQFPEPEFWASLFRRVPPRFRFAFKVPEQITRMEFSGLERYGGRAGERNPSFLDTDLLKSGFLDPLEPYRRNVSVLIFEFGALPPEHAKHPERFLDALDRFLQAVPQMFRMAVEVRNPELLAPLYFDCLRRHGVAHVYTAWARMPDLQEQIAIPGSVTADFVIARALLRRGRSYQQAVQMFEPYAELKEPCMPAREGLRELVQIDSSTTVPRFIFVNNRLEGNAPSTIEAVVL
jgi:uncharacterized protein YecE (DUF72 family)